MILIKSFIIELFLGFTTNRMSVFSSFTKKVKKVIAYYHYTLERCVPAPGLRKLEVVVRQEDIDAVLLFLGKTGVAQSINVNGQKESFDNLLEDYVVPCAITLRNSDILTRVNHQLEELEQKPEELIDKTPLPSKVTLKEILDEMEQKLSEIESRSKPFIETINLAATLARKIDHRLHAWKIDLKKLATKANISFSEKSPQKMLLEAEQKLSEIESRLEEIGKTSARCSSILSRIERLRKTFRVKTKEAPVQKLPFSPDEKFLAFIELRLSEIGNSLTANKPEESLIKELLTIESTITNVTEQISEAKANLIKQTLELRRHVNMVRQAVATIPELRTIHLALSSLRDMALEVDELIKVENNMARCAETVFFEAWVPKNYLEEVTEGICKITQGKCVIEVEPPSTEELVPTVIKPVPRLLEGFEKLTFSLGYPRSEEINPVWLMAITFPLLFGVLFGEFFGPSGVLHPILLTTIGPFQIGGFDPMHEPLNMLRFAIFVGVTLLSLGLVLRVVNNIRRQRFKSALISSCWIWLLLGGFFMWVYWGGISNITKWFAEGTPMFLGLTILPALLITIVTATSGSIMEGIDFSIEVLIESLDHTISFSRLAALFLTHTALNYMFLIIAGVKNGVFTLQSIPIIMLGSILALSIEGLVIFVHCLRLHWVELLPEFHSGKGIPYKPLKLNKRSVD